MFMHWEQWKKVAVDKHRSSKNFKFNADLQIKFDKIIYKIIHWQGYDQMTFNVSTFSNSEIDPLLSADLSKYPPTSIVVERNFSMLKILLAEDYNFLPDNVSMYFLFYYNIVNNMLSITN